MTTSRSSNNLEDSCESQHDIHQTSESSTDALVFQQLNQAQKTLLPSPRKRNLEPKKAISPKKKRSLQYINSCNVSLPDTHQIQINQFTIKQRINSGSFGKIFSGIYQDQPVAIKEILIRNDGSCENEIKSLIKLKESNNENVLRFYGYAFTELTGHFYLITELLSNGSLEDMIRQQEPQPWPALYEILKDIMNGLYFLHIHLNIVHRDIKSANIFLDGNNHAKIGDLGLSGPENNEIKFIGTYHFAAPEIRKAPYTKKSDIYSFGMIMLHMAKWSIFYKNLVFTDIIKYTREGKKDKIPECPAKLAQLIKFTTQVNPENRPDTKQLKNLLDLDKETIPDDVKKLIEQLAYETYDDESIKLTY